MKAKLLLIAAFAALIGVNLVLNRQMEEPQTPARPKTEGRATFQPGRTAVVSTSKGTFRFVLYEKDMPRTTRNFIRLARRGFYNGKTFHRYEPGFVIQGGAPGEHERKPRNIKFEYKEGLNHKPGAVGMAREADDYNSANCQFYVTLGEAKSLDGEYAVFGQVTSGMEVVRKLRAGDKIRSVRIVETGRGG